MTMATILSKAGLKMCILLSMAFFRGKVVKFQAIYNLATREMSNNLRKKGTEKRQLTWRKKSVNVSPKRKKL